MDRRKFTKGLAAILAIPSLAWVNAKPPNYAKRPRQEVTIRATGDYFYVEGECDACDAEPMQQYLEATVKLMDHAVRGAWESARVEIDITRPAVISGFSKSRRETPWDT